MSKRHDCAKSVHDRGGITVSFHACPRRGTINEEGDWWCKQHAPSAEDAREKASQARYDAEWEVRRYGQAARTSESALVTALLIPGERSGLSSRVSKILDRAESDRVNLRKAEATFRTPEHGK